MADMKKVYDDLIIINLYLFIFIFRKSRSPGKRSSRSPSRSPGRSTFGSDENDRVNNNNDAVGNNGESWRE